MSRSSLPLRRIEILGAFAAYSVLTAWWLWPLPRAMATHAGFTAFENVEPDYHLIVWGLAWGAHALVTTPFHLFHANAFYPAELSLAFSEHFLGYQPVFAPVYWLSHNPLLATNVVVLTSYPLSAVAMYALARRFVGPPAAAVGGFFYAFVPYRYLYSIYVHQLGVQYMPLAILCTERWLERGQRRDAVLLAVAMSFQMLSSIYLAYALVLGYGAYLPLAFWRWRGQCDRRRLAGLAVSLGAAAMVMAASSLPYLILRHMGVIPTYGGDREPLPIGLAFAAVMTSQALREQLVGPVGYGLALIGLLGMRRNTWPRVIGLVVTTVGIMAAFGLTIPIAGHVVPSPYRLLVEWLPGLSSIRVVVRFVATAQLGLALLASLGSESLTERIPATARWGVAAGIAGLALWSFSPLPALRLRPQPVGDTVPPAYRWLAEHGENRALLEVGQRSFSSEARRMYLSTFHWLPIVGGYTGYPPPTIGYLQGIAESLPDSAALQRIVDAVDVGWILVHRDELRPPVAARWSPRAGLPAGLEPANEWGPDLLLRVTRAMENNRRSRSRLDTTETFEGLPLAPITAPCLGALRLAMPLSEPWPPLGERHLLIEVRNSGTTAWPGRAAVPRHVVQLRACLAAPDEEDCVAVPQSLGADVPPGLPVTATVTVQAPARQGAYQLRLSLIQAGDTPLDRCGLATVRIPVVVARPKM